jgi:hypothetical protein
MTAAFSAFGGCSRSCYSIDANTRDGSSLEQQDLCGSDRIGQQVQQLLGLLIDSVEVFEDHHQRLIERFAQGRRAMRLIASSVSSAQMVISH